MKTQERFEISHIEIATLDPSEFKIMRGMKEWYLLRLIRRANDLGLEGKKIKEICSIQENFANMQMYIDFICEDTNDLP